MAIYHCSMKPVGRASGKSAVAAAAYRAGECLTNERDGLTHDFTRRDGVAHAQIVLPAGVDAAWAQDRSALWNMAERAEHRCDARVAREFEIALPHELDADQRLALTQSFAADLANRYGVAVDLAIHEPGRGTDIRNHHAHLLMTTRTVGEDGFGEKTEIEWKNARLLSDNRPTAQMQLRDLRQAWEDHANDHLARAGHETRIDHRSHLERGLELEPTQHMGVYATQMERRGLSVARLRQEAEANARNRDLIAQKPEAVLALITNEKSVFTRHDVARTLHRYVEEPAEFQNAFAAVMQSPALVQLKPEMLDGRGQVQELARLSTREMVSIERSMVEAAGRMNETSRHPVDDTAIERSLAARSFLAEEQRAAVRHVTGDEQIAAVVGLAGAGKSTMLAAAREAWEADGYRVHGAALAGKAAEGLEASSGIASRTLASWEMSWQNGRGELSARDVFVIDEAGMVSSKQMARFVDAAERSGAKLVLVGDPEQLQPIQAGAAFRAITEQTGFARLDEIRRQQDEWQREASVDFAGHRTGEALSGYDAHGAVRFAETRAEAREAIVGAVMADREANPEDSRLVLTYRRADVRDLNEAIRGELLQRGELQEGVAFQTNDGERRFAEGDRILFLENNRDLGVKNGMLGTVEAIEPERLNIRLDDQRAASARGSLDENQDRRTIELDAARYTAFDHGYATTIHKSQGATVDRSFVLASPGMDSHLAYVAMTRHREDVQLHAGRDDFKDIEALGAGLSHANTKETTLDYAERRGIDVERQAEREALHESGRLASMAAIERQAEQIARIEAGAVSVGGARESEASADRGDAGRGFAHEPHEAEVADRFAAASVAEPRDEPTAGMTIAERLARLHEEADRDLRAGGHTPNERVHDMQAPETTGQDTQGFEQQAERSPVGPEEERIARLRALFAEDRKREEPDEQRIERLRAAFAEDRKRQEPDEQRIARLKASFAEDRMRQQEPAEERTARLRASMAEFLQSQVLDPQRIERLRASFAERPAPESTEERVARLRSSFSKSDERSAPDERQASMAERLAELRERESAPKERTREDGRERHHERDRGDEWER